MALGQLIVSPVLAADGLAGRTRIRLADQACHRHHRREPQLRPRVRHLRAEAAGRKRRSTCSPRASSSSTTTTTRSPAPTSRRRTSSRRRMSAPTDAFLLSPPKQTFPNDQLPAPLVGGPKVSYIPNECGSTPITSCSASLALAKQSESGLDPDYYQYLLTGGTGQTSQDARPAHQQCQRAACGTVSADQRQRAPV